MRVATWESSAGALAAFLNSAVQCYMADLFTITLSGGAVLRYTSADVAVTVNGSTFAVGPLIRRGKTKLSIGISVDTLDLSINAGPAVTVNGVPMLQFIAAGGLDGATVLLERVFAPAPPSAEARRNLLAYSTPDSNLGWSLGVNQTRVGNTTAPDGTNTAVVYSQPVAGNAYVIQRCQFNAATTYTVSCYVKLVSGTSPTGGGLFTIDYDSDGVNTTWERVVKPLSSVTLTTAWQRFSFTVTDVAAINSYIYICNDYGPGCQIALWGAQVEVGSTPTTYQPIVGTYTAQSPWVGTLGLFVGRVSDTNASRYEAALTINSDSELLNVMVPRNVYQPGCSNTLFDGACALAKATYAVAATANGSTDATRTTFSTALGQSAGYFAQGWAVGLTGGNAGVGRTIKAWAGGLVTTIQPWPAVVSAGDTFTLYPGCDKQMATCSAKFANLSHFRGQPFVPAPETVT